MHEILEKSGLSSVFAPQLVYASTRRNRFTVTVSVRIVDRVRFGVRATVSNRVYVVWSRRYRVNWSPGQLVTG